MKNKRKKSNKPIQKTSKEAKSVKDIVTNNINRIFAEDDELLKKLANN